MRLVGTLHQEREAFRLQSYLKSVQIPCKYEVSSAGNGGVFHIWIYSEDDYAKALELFDEFSANPSSTKFDVQFTGGTSTQEEKLENYVQDMQASLEAAQQAKIHSFRRTLVTRWMIFMCIIVLFWNTYDRYQWIKAHTSEEHMVEPQEIPLTRIEEAMLYDDPDLTSARGVWQGYYNNWVAPQEDQSRMASFTWGKIGDGEVWRFITPSFLHAGILHLLFNMLWLWLLGKQIEEKLGAIRYILLVLFLGALSNTAQYLMSGFSFVGFSGIICGLAGYIWIRQKIAPWEGYALQKGTIAFLMIFVLGIAALQVVSFGLQFFQIANLSLQIANTAHIVGALSGIILARIPGFSK